MKTKLLLVLSAFITTMAASVSIASGIGTVGYSEICSIEPSDEWADKFICIDDDYSDEIIRYSYKCLPEKIRQEITVVVIEDDILKNHEDIALNGEDGELSGLYDNRNNFIYVKDDKYSAKDSMIHETGHCMDRNRGFMSRQDDFCRIYAAEAKESGLCEHGISNASEYFAESFKAVITGGREYKKLCKNAPLTAEYMGKFIEENS